MKTKLNVYIEQDQKEELEKRGEERDRSVSYLTREAISEWISRQEEKDES